MVLKREELSQKGYHPAQCIDEAACPGCLSCAIMCPDVAITIVKEG
jgi:2-oxoglutarate ferredoxin oxidoreductase subunit delta